ncbi:MAG: HAD family phosphatase [Rhodospirillaceae bacterium]|nr:HAD family phosphatase [Rhodospirillaceae bacterium]
MPTLPASPARAETGGPETRPPGAPQAVVFDLGGVLIDWDPRHLYRKLLPDDPARMEWFLSTICTDAWNEEQDAGRPFADAVALLCRRHPEHADLIRAYDERWPEMLNGAHAETVAILEALRRRGRPPLYALTNWSAEKFPVALERFAFLRWFDGIVVSGELGLRKPDPRLFRHLLERFGLQPETTFFVDDSRRNVEAARALGLDAVLFTTAQALRSELARRGLL